PIILQAWLTLPSCLASSSRPILARMIFCSVVMVSSNAPRRGASPPQPLRAPPRLAIRRGDRTLANADKTDAKRGGPIAWLTKEFDLGGPLLRATPNTLDNRWLDRR